MSLCHELSTVSTSWAMLRTCGGILLGPQSSMRWRNTVRSGSAFQSFASDTQNKSSSSLSPDNYRRLRLWVWTRAPLLVPYLHPDRRLPDPVRVQAFLRTYLPIFGNDERFPYRGVLTFITTSSATRTSTITRVHGVTKIACAWHAYVSTPASDSVTNNVEIASSRYLT